ncbi:MAG: hypothetical protein KDH15_12130 [Rhodocyclaceae bacterium]|nr:hypothetical protein [Rhodocyclaceae bacterium]
MPKLTKAQRDAIAEHLSFPLGSVIFIADGRKVALQMRRWSKNRVSYRVCLFLDGWFKGEWTKAEPSIPEHKYLRRAESFLFPAAKRKEIEKKFGKRALKRYGFDKKLVMYRNDWATGRAAINHLCKACESVELVSTELTSAPLTSPDPLPEAAP